MRHLRERCGIEIKGSPQKRQLESYGYYHGYKGYRFFQNSTKKIPFNSFDEVVAVIEYDSQLKAMLYPDLMYIETALKNRICYGAVNGLNDSTFETVFRERMNDVLSNSRIQEERLKLRNSIYSQLSKQYRAEKNKDNQMVRHFFNRGQDAPLWVIFEILYLSETAKFFRCLNKTTREEIMDSINLNDPSVDTNANLLGDVLFTIKALRNAVAHNNVVFDTRFKDRNISRVLKQWLETETGINNISLYYLVDYIILLACILKHVDFSGNRAFKLLEAYRHENQVLRDSVPQEIYSMIIPNNVEIKLEKLENYLGEKPCKRTRTKVQ